MKSSIFSPFVDSVIICHSRRLAAMSFRTQPARSGVGGITDSALTDPCVNHTVLDQPWRSSDCDVTGCSGQEKCDDNLHFGWYLFKSSGGWKIPETAVPHHRCSTNVTGWLQGSHPSVGQGEVTRTVCLYWGRKHCDKVHEIKIKNCSSYFVYELKSLFRCAAYCTDPETVETEEPEEQTTRESTRGSSSTPAVSGTSETSTTSRTKEQTTPHSIEKSPSNPIDTFTSEPMTSQTQESEEQSTGESIEVSSSILVGSGTPEPVTYETQESEEQSTAESTEGPSCIPAGSGSSGICLVGLSSQNHGIINRLQHRKMPFRQSSPCQLSA
ncbi:uncharacterized protein [Heterodontus francisci]|uniref:uncharacterized protein n=1 Tax=Heterodontus francisci TaxID=7792 RepID=UPI00355B834D